MEEKALAPTLAGLQRCLHQSKAADGDGHARNENKSSVEGPSAGGLTVHQCHIFSLVVTQLQIVVFLFSAGNERGIR